MEAGLGEESDYANSDRVRFVTSRKKTVNIQVSAPDAGLSSRRSIRDYATTLRNCVSVGLFPDYPGSDGGLSSRAQPDSDYVRVYSRPAISRFPRRHL